LPVEQTVVETVASGADLVAFSGDKLLGGPQAGILVGRAAAIARTRKHPLMRMLRPDKLTLAALGATLACYRDDRLDEVPALAMLRRTPDAVRAAAEAIAAELAPKLASSELVIEVRPCISTVGGGAMPTAQLPSWALTLRHPHHSASGLDSRLRVLHPPIIGRLEDGHVWLDLRTVPPSDQPALLAGLAMLC
jgi:L-seryl-tRNA(Ser) seleniumtransferase